MKRSRTTIRDVARRAGVSVATVSAVINERTSTVPLSQSARTRVRKAIDALNYRVNTQARTLRTGRSYTIGVIAADLTQPFTGESIRLIEQETTRRHYHFLLSDIQNSSRMEAVYLDLFRQKQVEGILMIGAACRVDTDAVRGIIDSGIPVVMTERDVRIQTIPCVMVDNVRGGRLATEHLLDLGHQRIACIAGPRGNVAARQRTQGYRNAMRCRNLRSHEHIVVSKGMELRHGYDAMNHLLTGTRPSAVFAFNDMLALGAVRAIHEAGMRIPQDIALVGYDDIPLASYATPSLTTIRQPLLHMCREAVNLLLDILDGQQPGHSTPRNIHVRPQGVTTTGQHGWTMPRGGGVSDGKGSLPGRYGTTDIQPDHPADRIILQGELIIRESSGQ